MVCGVWCVVWGVVSVERVVEVRVAPSPKAFRLSFQLLTVFTNIFLLSSLTLFFLYYLSRYTETLLTLFLLGGLDKNGGSVLNRSFFRSSLLEPFLVPVILRFVV